MMAEKQREIMLQRQREFEQRHKPQGGTGAPNGVDLAKSAAGLPVKTKISLGEKKAAQEHHARSIDEEVPQSTQEEKPTKLEVTDNGDEKPSKEEPAKESISSPAEGSTPADVASKYILKEEDVNARRSKNVHDYSMYAKDVTRRTSFNPRPKESPFTPDMMAKMKEGHEAMMKKELDEKEERLRNGGAEKTALPTFEDESDKVSQDTSEKPNEGAETTTVKGDDEAENKERAKKQETEEFALSTEEATVEQKSRRATEGADADSQYVARDANDRKSKNIHDLGQCKSSKPSDDEQTNLSGTDFNRRASHVPDAPGGARRKSFNPETMRNAVPPPGEGS